MRVLWFGGIAYGVLYGLMLAHELGHAVVTRAFGYPWPQVVIGWGPRVGRTGWVTWHCLPGPSRTTQQTVVSPRHALWIATGGCGAVGVIGVLGVCVGTPWGLTLAWLAGVLGGIDGVPVGHGRVPTDAESVCRHWRGRRGYRCLHGALQGLLGVLWVAALMAGLSWWQGAHP